MKLKLYEAKVPGVFRGIRINQGNYIQLCERIKNSQLFESCDAGLYHPVITCRRNGRVWMVLIEGDYVLFHGDADGYETVSHVMRAHQFERHYREVETKSTH